MTKLYSILFAMLAFCGLAQAQVTFDFTGDDAYKQFGLEGVSTASSGDIEASTAGDFVEDGSATIGDVTLTVSPSTTNTANRMWTGSLRLYGGTLTVASKGEKITAISFSLNSGKWGSNTADSGTLGTGTWTGSASSVVITIGGNTQIKSITVTLGEGGDTPDPQPSIDWTSSATAPLTVASVLEKGAQLSSGENSSEKVYVKGKVSSIRYVFDEGRGTATFSISDDGEAANEFLCYGTYYLGNRSWKEGDEQIEVGDEVVVYGTVTNYSGTLEMANKNNYLYSLNGETGAEVVIPIVPSIEAMQRIAQVLGTSKRDVQYTFSDVVVTYVSGKYIYVKDATRAILLYGTNAKNLKAGDVISGSISGQLQLYSGLTELGFDNLDGITVAEGAAPAPEVVAEVGAIIADATRLEYESKLLTIEGVSISVADDGAMTIVDDSDNELPIYIKSADQANFKDLVIDADATYNVTGIVGYHDGVQFTPRSAEDFVNVAEADLQTPESGWEVANTVVALGETVTAKFTTNSDASVVYDSSNEDVATIDENGTITVKGAGQTTISAETAATATFKSDYKEFTLTVTSGATGAIEKPYTVADVLAFAIEAKTDTIQKQAWVMGYIVGTVKSNKLALGAEEAAATNIAIAATADEEEVFLPVELPKGDVRTALNLADNPTLLGKQVWLCGTITQYFSMNGLKEVSNYSFDGEDAVRAISVDAAADGAIYTIAGQRLNRITKPGIYVVGGRKVVVK